MKKSPFEIIPGVGPKMAVAMKDLGYSFVSDLRGKDPTEMYDRLRIATGGELDRCVLYVFRCAVYFAENEKHDPELLKWWNWKDSN